MRITLIKSQLSDFDARAVFRVEFEKAKGRVGSPSSFLYFKTCRGFSFEAEFHGSVFIKALGGLAPATLWVEDFFVSEGLPGVSGSKIFEQADARLLAKEFGKAMAYAYAAGLGDRAPDNFVLMEDKNSKTGFKIANIDLTTAFQRTGSLEEVFNILELLLVRKKSEHALNKEIAASFIDSFCEEFVAIKETAAGLKFDFRGHAQQKIEQALAHIAAANPQTLRKQLLNYFQSIKPK
ncbi:MAG: hypothetical protein QXH27_02780 [Candidatus Micrarchaeia archaeon]